MKKLLQFFVFGLIILVALAWPLVFKYSSEFRSLSRRVAKNTSELLKSKFNTGVAFFTSDDISTDTSFFQPYISRDIKEVRINVLDQTQPRMIKYGTYLNMDNGYVCSYDYSVTSENLSVVISLNSAHNNRESLFDSCITRSVIKSLTSANAELISTGKTLPSISEDSIISSLNTYYENNKHYPIQYLSLNQ